MAYNFRNEGEAIQCAAPVGGVTVDVPALIDCLFGVPAVTAAEGETFNLLTKGVWDALPKTTGTAWTPGEKLYWNDTTHKFTTLTTDTDVGATAVDAAESSATTGAVYLSGMGAAGGTPSKLGMLVAAVAGTGAKLLLAEPTGGGASVVTVVAPALAADATITLPATTTDLGAEVDKIAALGAENTDVEVSIDVTAAVAESGTWTAGVSATGVKSLTHTPAAAAQKAWISIPMRTRTASGKGFKPTSLVVNYSAGTAVADDIRFELWKRTLGADNAAPSGAVLGGQSDAHYDADHNTAAKRGDITSAPELHRATVTLPSPAYLAADEQLVLRVYVDGDAGASNTFALTGATLRGSETVVDLA